MVEEARSVPLTDFGLKGAEGWLLPEAARPYGFPFVSLYWQVIQRSGWAHHRLGRRFA